MMNARELRELVAKGESDHLEFKKSTGQRTEGAKAENGEVMVNERISLR